MLTVGVKRQEEHTPTAFNGTVYTEAVQWQCTLIHCNTRQLNFSKNTLIVTCLKRQALLLSLALVCECVHFRNFAFEFLTQCIHRWNFAFPFSSLIIIFQLLWHTTSINPSITVISLSGNTTTNNKINTEQCKCGVHVCVQIDYYTHPLWCCRTRLCFSGCNNLIPQFLCDIADMMGWDDCWRMEGRQIW